MRRAFSSRFAMAVVTVVLTGLVYPLAVWGLARSLFPKQAAGSLVTARRPPWSARR